MNILYLKVDKDTVPEGFDHIATDWEIALDGNFIDIIHRSLNNTQNLYEYVYLNYRNAYVFGRCRFIFEDGKRGNWSGVIGCGGIPSTDGKKLPC